MICGIDEAGRGALAGPVFAASVMLPDDFPLETLDDSKKLSAKKRALAEKIILEKALAYGIGWATHTEIDEINILKASLLAMKRAFEAIPDEKRALISEIIVDGLYIPPIEGVSQRAIVKADAIFPAVMAASILAKQARDRIMTDYARIYPNYGYEKHKGYPNKAHIAQIRLFGLPPIQRLSFQIPFSTLDNFSQGKLFPDA